MTDLKALNKQRLDQIKENGMSHGMEVFIYAIKKAHSWNRAYIRKEIDGTEKIARRTGRRKRYVPVYFSWVTDNRLMAHIISADTCRLERLVIPEAGHRLYANNKDGYQANGSGYSKPFHVLEAMVDQARKILDWEIGPLGDWQSYIKAEVIA